MICSRDECDNYFTPTTHNNIYCSDECCKIATLDKARKANKDRRDRLSGKKRICSADGCKNSLSRYNEASVCEVCMSRERKKKRLELLSMIGAEWA
jgi:hypothetical protein